jgi:hypothetical protein
MGNEDLVRIVGRVEGLMEDLQTWLIQREDDARSSGDRDAAKRWRERRVRLRAYRQGLVTLLYEESDTQLGA